VPLTKVEEVIFGFGHPNVKATHHATVEFTKDFQLSRNGDCVLVVGADKGLAEFSQEFKGALQKPNAKLTVKIEVGGLTEEIQAQGSPHLVLSNPKEMVLRKSDFPSDRTLGIRADKAAKDLSRELVEKLKSPNQKAKITLTVRASGFPRQARPGTRRAPFP
jgi:uncharacterized protein